MNKIKKYITRGIITGLALAGLYSGISNLPKIRRTKDNPKLVVSECPWGNPDIRNYSEHPIISYIDKAPLGSLDYIVDYTSGERVERQPTSEEYETFSRLEKEAKEKGLIAH